MSRNYSIALKSTPPCWAPTKGWVISILQGGGKFSCNGLQRTSYVEVHFVFYVNAINEKMNGRFCGTHRHFRVYVNGFMESTRFDHA